MLKESLNSNNTPPLLISEKARTTIRDFLRNNLSNADNALSQNEGGCYFFRRFDRIISSSSPVSITRHFGPDVYETLNNVTNLDVETIKKSVEIKHKWFSGFTASRAIRDEHASLENKEIYLHSENYSQIDMSLNYTFKFSDVRQLRSHITPVNEDLIFIFISSNTLNSLKSSTSSTITNTTNSGNNKNNKKIKPKADAWCIVSEQFLRAWTLIRYDWHESFDKYIAINTPISEREKALREKLFIGNKLMTNSWLKHHLSLAANGKTMDTEESRKRYYYLRTEYVSKKWVDVYAALVLIARYGELPCPVNVPNNSHNNSINKDDLQEILYRRDAWSLPDVFVTMVLHKCAPNLIITDHLQNYNAWKDYSTSSTMLSIHGQKHKGFFDDIHQIKLNSLNLPSSDSTKSNNTNDVANFPALSFLNSAATNMEYWHAESKPFFESLKFKSIEIEPDINDSIDPPDMVINNNTWAGIVKMGSRGMHRNNIVEFSTLKLPERDLCPMLHTELNSLINEKCEEIVSNVENVDVKDIQSCDEGYLEKFRILKDANKDRLP
jgi:hypothetical protein